MNKHIATALALVVVSGAFLAPVRTFLLEPGGSAEETGHAPLSLFLPSFSFPQWLDIGGSTAAAEAWKTFEAYRQFARTHDLPGLKSLSYQLSPACSDEARLQECYGLMDSVYFFTQGFRQSDFTEILSDDRQVTLSTDYLEPDKVKYAIYFARDEGILKVLGIRFCTGADTADDKCIEADPQKRDLDGDGWWDDVEALFRPGN